MPVYTEAQRRAMAPEARRDRAEMPYELKPYCGPSKLHARRRAAVMWVGVMGLKRLVRVSYTEARGVSELAW